MSFILDSASGGGGLVSSWDAPSIDSAEDDVLLIGLLQITPRRTISPPAGWTSRVSLDNSTDDIRMAILDRTVSSASGPYHDTFSVSGGTTYWSMAQLGFRSLGSVPSNTGSAFAGPYSDSSSIVTRSVTASFRGATTLGDVLVAYFIQTTYAGTGGGTGTGVPDGWLLLETVPGTAHIGASRAYYKIADGTETSVTFTQNEAHQETLSLLLAEYPINVAVPGVFIDWDNDGFASGAHDDVTANTMSWDISRGASAQITGGAESGSCTLVLKNPDDIYNPRNTDSPLYGLLRDGVRVWVGVNSDGTLIGSDPRGLFAGRITDITPLPAGGADDSPTVEIVCEDLLGWARRLTVHLDYAEGRSHAELRQAALDYAGETRYDLGHEITTMPLSHADADLLSVLEQINSVNGTRHLAKPADNYTDWFDYVTRNRQWRLDATVDGSVDAGSEHVTGTSGWRLSADTVINQQKATVQPIAFTPGTFTVWEAEKLPIGLTSRTPQTFWVEFDDVVFDANLDIDSSGSAVTSTLTVFGTTAKLELSTAGTSTISALSIEGRLARRPPQESYVADDTTSQAAPRGVRAGSEITGEYVGVMASARGIAEHVIWRYGDPQLRPTMTVANWLPDQFERDLYDVLDFTSTQLKMSDHVFEIVGVQHHGLIAAPDVQYHTADYVLQESKVQADPGWFILDTSLLDGSDILAY